MHSQLTNKHFNITLFKRTITQSEAITIGVDFVSLEMQSLEHVKYRV